MYPKVSNKDNTAAAIPTLLKTKFEITTTKFLPYHHFYLLYLT